ncbi:MAG: class I SAM-dependent methyltransferase [Flavobacteriales bacterium]|nr:class I SAM-dependent methyltransferase [Flavobacteriales bacterium]
MKNVFLHRIKSWLNWRMHSVSWRSIHSPWLFSLLQTMRGAAISWPEIEQERSRLLHDQNDVPPLDLGAGSQSKARTVAEIAQNALKRPRHARALAGLARHMDAVGVLELGTCLGITTAYLGKHAASVTTIEGNPALAKHSEDVWQRLNVQNVTSIVGNFDDVLPSLPPQQYDLVFIDGNHRGSALLQYVNELAPYLTEKGVIVCDDIHWSRDMESAWDELIQENRWSLRVDFYEWGLLTANPSLAREFHCIRF